MQWSTVAHILFTCLVYVAVRTCFALVDAIVASVPSHKVGRIVRRQGNDGGDERKEDREGGELHSCRIEVAMVDL